MPNNVLEHSTAPPDVEIFYDQRGNVSLERALHHTPRFFDYEMFESIHPPKRRSEEWSSFLQNEIYVPSFDYARLRERTSSGKLGGYNYIDTDKRANKEVMVGSSKKEVSHLLDCISIVNARRGVVGDQAANLYINMFDILIGRELLVQESYSALFAGNAERRDTHRHRFMELNELLYGEVDQGLFLGIMQTERERLSRFEPVDEAGHKLKRELTPFFDGLEIEGNREPEFISQDFIDSMLPLLEEEYGHIFAILPDTDDSVIYSSDQVVEFINKTLQAGGLKQAGWVAVINPDKNIVSTNTTTKKIEIPPNDSRTARQLKALVVHEQEVHARRGQNGLESSAPGLLGSGTANYADVEEGLGMALECIVNGTAEGNVAVKRARDRYIHVGLALGIGSHSPRDAREVYELAWRMEALALAEKNGGVVTPQIILEAQQGKWGAKAHVENIFRGTDFVGKGIIYMKAKVYLEGFTKSVHALRDVASAKTEEEKRDRFKGLFLGKFDHTNPEEMHFAEKMTEAKKP
jgi:hypothetical protein